MSKYLEEYTTESYLLLANKLRTIENHISHYPILDEMLGFQYHLNVEFIKFYKSQNPIELKKYMPELSIHVLFQYNTHSLESALNDIECDRIHQAAANIRTVYESIPKMYYISLNPKEAGLIMVHEHITGMPFEQVLKEIKGEDCIKYLDGKESPITTKNKLKKFNKKYSLPEFVKRFYFKKRQESIEKSYDDLSNSVHPNITRNKRLTSYDPENTEFFFKLLESLSFFNIQAYLAGNQTLLSKIRIDHEILYFLNEKDKQLGSLIKGVYFYPDKKI